MIEKTKEYALIVAGGQGRRMEGETPKQFIPLCGKPLLLHTVEAFCRYSDALTVIVVISKAYIEQWEKICRQFHFDRPIQVEPGGSTRFLSVKNGLEALRGEGLVAIHDGVRPLVSSEIIAASFQKAKYHQTAVAVVPLIDSICSVRNSLVKPKKRDRYRFTQTPQTFDIALIKKAYASIHDIHASDDASIAARAGHAIHSYEGSPNNIKITIPQDLVLAEVLLKSLM